MEMRIAAPQPFDFANNLDYLARSANECLYYVENGKVYKLMEASDEHVLVELSGDGEGILMRFLTGVTDERTGFEAVRYVREWFDLDTDLNPFYTMAREDKLLRKVVDRFHGTRLIGIPDLFEAMCWGILGQQINLAFAYTLKRRFVESFGQSLEHKGRKYWVFPSPHMIAELSVGDLTGLQLTTKKSEYLIGAARLLTEGKLSKAQLLDAMDDKAAEKLLTAIRGIGPWTAHYVLMRCLRDPSAFPIADVGLHNAIKQMLELDKKPSYEEIRQLSSGWTNWEAYATFYLWRSLY